MNESKNIIPNYNQEQFTSWKNYLNSQKLLREAINNPIVSYGGTSGSYSEDATIKFFGEDSIRVPCRKFEDVFKSIAGGAADYGVIPIENTTTGSVKDILELLDKYQCYIVGETQVQVDHCLLGTPDSNIEDIKDIYTHEQSIMQCSIYLEDHPNWEIHPYLNNALAAELVSKNGDKTLAAIASERAGDIHNLKVLEKHINFLDINTTRFIIVANHPENRNANKISLSFSVGHEPGALVRVLNIFDKYHLNLSKIESRPSRKRNWEYNFYIDIEGSIDKEFDKTIKEVIGQTKNFKFLGSYKANIE